MTMPPVNLSCRELVGNFVGNCREITQIIYKCQMLISYGIHNMLSYSVVSINLQRPKDAYWRLSGLLKFQAFFDHFLLLLEKKTEFIRFCTKFHVKQAKFLCCLSVLVCCCAANHYSEIAVIFSKILKNSARSKG